MLEPAIRYKGAVTDKYYSIWNDPFYKYLWLYEWRDTSNIVENSWEEHQYVSVKDGEVIGYIGYGIKRSARVTDSWTLVLFNRQCLREFYKDAMQVIDEHFTLWNFSKMEWDVVTKNPAMSVYDKLAARFGGSVTGIKHKTCMVSGGELCDVKSYELFREDYLKNRDKRRVS